MNEELDAFCRREHPRLVGALTLHCGDRWVAAELAQEALARVCADWPRVSRMQAPGAWVHRVAMNLCTSHFRRRTAERAARARYQARQVPTSRLSRPRRWPYGERSAPFPSDSALRWCCATTPTSRLSRPPTP